MKRPFFSLFSFLLLLSPGLLPAGEQAAALLERLRAFPDQKIQILLEAGSLKRSERLAFLQGAAQALPAGVVSSAVFDLFGAGDTESAVWALEIMNHLPRGHDFRLLGFEQFASLAKRADAGRVLLALKNRRTPESDRYLSTWLLILAHREKDSRLADQLWKLTSSSRVDRRIRTLAARALEGQSAKGLDRKLVRLYVKEYAGDVRSGLLRAMSSSLDPRYLSIVAESRRKRRYAPREETRELLRLAGRLGSDQGLAFIRDTAIYERDLQFRIRAVDLLAQYSEHPRFLETIREIQELQIEERGVRLQMWLSLLEALARSKHPKAPKLLLEATSHPELRIRLGAAYLLQHLPVGEQVARYAALLEDPSPHVLTVALWGLIRLGTLQAIEAIFDKLPFVAKAGGLPFRDAIRFLSRLTGEKHGEDADAWRRWRQEHELTPETVERLKGATSRKQGRTMVLRFFEHRIVSKHPLFVVDISTSMGNSMGFLSRVEVLYVELANVLRSLDEDTRFSLIAFGDSVHLLPGGPRPATESNTSEALRFLKELGLKPGTNYHAALRAALETKESDTVYFLSDGNPTTGELRTTEELARWVKKENATRGLILNTISIGIGTEVLQRLAHENHGIHKSVE